MISQFVFFSSSTAVLHHYYYPHRLRRFDGDTHYKLTLADVWPNECADACLLQMSFDCKSFDYDRTLRTCSLSDVSSANVGLIPATDGYPYDHFERGSHLKKEKDSEQGKKSYVSFGPGTCNSKTTW